jgi:hypothetical protein
VIAEWLDYRMVALVTISVISILLLPWILRFFKNPISPMRLWGLIGGFWIVDTVQRAIFYYGFTNAYLTMYSAWVVPIILLLLFCCVSNWYIARYEKAA